MTTTVSSKGQIVLPAQIRKQDRIEPGQGFAIERLDRGARRQRLESWFEETVGDRACRALFL